MWVGINRLIRPHYYMCARYRYKILHIDLSDLSTVFVRWFHGIEKNCGQIDVLITVLPSQAGIGSCHFKMYKYNLTTWRIQLTVTSTSTREYTRTYTHGHSYTRTHTHTHAHTHRHAHTHTLRDRDTNNTGSTGRARPLLFTNIALMRSWTIRFEVFDWFYFKSYIF